jgi:hypothetical protein
MNIKGWKSVGEVYGNIIRILKCVLVWEGIFHLRTPPDGNLFAISITLNYFLSVLHFHPISRMHGVFTDGTI